MEHLYTSKRLSKVFRGFVLALAVVLVACGGESDDPEPTATTTSGQEQEALPTVPPMESTPDTEMSEDEITVLEPETPATSAASTPDADEDEEVAEADVVSEDPAATPPGTPIDAEVASTSTSTSAEGPSTPQTDAETDASASPEAEIAVTETEDATAQPETEGEAGVATAQPGSEDETDETLVAGDDQASEEAPVGTAIATATESTPDATDETSTGNETYTNPGDGTGGSGMPGEQDFNVESDESPQASPEASPIAQLTISGCEVPDVPGFLGESNIFLLTADVNFRSGPGVFCDPLLDEPVGEGQIVLVLGGPVTQADDETEWVQVEINGESGWITTEFLEPSE